MRIALAQLNYHIGNFEGNFAKIAKALEQAAEQQAELLVLAELAVTGYPPRDFLEFTDFIDRSVQVVERIATEANRYDMAVIVGAPSVNPRIEGKDLFNSAYFLYEGKIQAVRHKALLPTYDIFDEYRYFEPATQFDVIEFKGKKLAVTVCEDLWNVGNENPMYTTCPMDHLIHQKPDVMINISASPFDYTQANKRLHMLKANAARYHLPILYVNHVGAQTEIIFDGGSVAMNDAGVVVDELPYFTEEVRTYELASLYQLQHAVEDDQLQSREKIPLMYHALVEGIRNYFRKLGFTKAILGLSGGMDSALVLVLAAEALGKENVRGILMPSPFSSEHSIADAVELSKRLGTRYDIIPIEKVYQSSLEVLDPFFEGKGFGLAEENLQARIRANYLMALSNKHGYILLNTSNKSEAAVGYSTLYGDMCGGLSVLGDVYKTEVYDLARWYNRDREIIPLNIIDKAPSAELRPDQKDTDSLPPYDILDPLLYQYIEHRKGPRELVEMGFEKALVDRVLKLVNTSEYKRYQTPPILRVSPKAFGMGRRMPIVGKYLA